MIVDKPLIRGSITLNCHPLGCREAVERQIHYVKQKEKFLGPKTALIIGGSSGFGLASAISLVFGSDTKVINVSFESGPNAKRLGSPGWFNNAYLRTMAEKEGKFVKNIIGDAFSNELKQEVIQAIQNLPTGSIDLLVYSLASPKRTDPQTGITYTSSIKSTTERIMASTINLEKETLEEGIMEVATEQEISDTVKVMGGEDWGLWIHALADAGVLAPGFKTFAESYYGSPATYPIYRDGTLGAAKRNLEKSADALNIFLKESYQGEALICVSKAVTTKASAYIPLFSLYAAALYKIMKAQGVHETPIEHKYRFFKDMLYGTLRESDEQGRLRPDSREMKPQIQTPVMEILQNVHPDNFKNLTDYAGFYQDFLELSGFGFDNIHYHEDFDEQAIRSLKP